MPLYERKLYALLPGPITAANLTWFQKRGDRPKNFDHKSTNKMPPQCQLTEASEEDETLSQHSEILPGRKWFREGMTSSTWRRQRRLRNSVQNMREERSQARSYQTARSAPLTSIHTRTGLSNFARWHLVVEGIVRNRTRMKSKRPSTIAGRIAAAVLQPRRQSSK